MKKEEHEFYLKAFFRFLKNNHSYAAFIDNVKDGRLKYILDENYNFSNVLFMMFTWSTSKQGVYYWKLLDTKWRKFYKSINFMYRFNND